MPKVILLQMEQSFTTHKTNTICACTCLVYRIRNMYTLRMVNGELRSLVETFSQALVPFSNGSINLWDKNDNYFVHYAYVRFYINNQSFGYSGQN